MYDGGLGKHAGVQFECKKYPENRLLCLARRALKAKKEAEAAEKARSKIHILRIGSNENEH